MSPISDARATDMSCAGRKREALQGRRATTRYQANVLVARHAMAGLINCADDKRAAAWDDNLGDSDHVMGVQIRPTMADNHR